MHGGVHAHASVFGVQRRWVRKDNLDHRRRGDRDQHLQTLWDSFEINITCSISNQLTSQPLIINDRVHHLVPWQVYLKGLKRSYIISYSHMTDNKSTTLDRIEPTLSMWYSRRYMEDTLFGIKLSLPSNKSYKMMVYSIPKSKTSSTGHSSA